MARRFGRRRKRPRDTRPSHAPTTGRPFPVQRASQRRRPSHMSAQGALPSTRQKPTADKRPRHARTLASTTARR
eukprot:7424688-Pyramimonas_sp.AAC.1